jgi:hypothetical protein
VAAAVLLVLGTIARDSAPVHPPGPPPPAVSPVAVAAAPQVGPTPAVLSPAPTFHDGDGPVGSFLTTKSQAVAR